jgi:hypothetical protein
MRSRTSHAAKSGVGEHTARESECAQRVRRERARGERPNRSGRPARARPIKMPKSLAGEPRKADAGQKQCPY